MQTFLRVDQVIVVDTPFPGLVAIQVERDCATFRQPAAGSAEPPVR